MAKDDVSAPGPADPVLSVVERFRTDPFVRSAAAVLLVAFVLEVVRAVASFGGVGDLLGFEWMDSPGTFEEFELWGMLGGAIAAVGLVVWVAGGDRWGARVFPVPLFGLALLMARFELTGELMDPTFLYYVAGGAFLDPLTTAFWLGVLVVGTVLVVMQKKPRAGHVAIAVALVALAARHWFTMIFMTAEDSGNAANGPAASFAFALFLTAAALMVAAASWQGARVGGAVLVFLCVFSVSLTVYGRWVWVAYGLMRGQLGHVDAFWWGASAWTFMVGGAALFVASLAVAVRAEPGASRS